MRNLRENRPLVTSGQMGEQRRDGCDAAKNRAPEGIHG